MSEVNEESKHESGVEEVSSEISIPVEAPKKESAYGDISGIPTMEAVDGIRYDFNSGLRVYFPQSDNRYRLRFMDADTGIILYDADVTPGTVITSVKKYYLRYYFEITRQGTGEKVFDYTLDLKDKDVIVQFPVNTIGDSVGWFSYVERFQKKFGCRVALVISDFLKELVEKQYPQFKYIKKNETAGYNSFATYYIGLFGFKDNEREERNFSPVDFRAVGLHRVAAYILGLRTKEELEDIPPRFDLSAKKKSKGKYVVISCKASAQCKFWNNPYGWDGVIRFLKENGYRVICIDKNRIYGKDIIFNQLPWGVEDETGEKTLQERIDLIKDADFFIGLSSGLSWLAWGCGVPVVMISGFTSPNTEFYTPYRIINYQACNGCWDDVRCTFDHGDYFWCPRHKDDDRKYECSRLITPEQVIGVIKTVPSFKPGK